MYYYLFIFIKFDFWRASNYAIRAGSTIRSSGGVLIKVEKVINHPKYGGSGFDSDISILKLSEALVYTNDIKPIKLHDAGEDVPDGADTIVSG